MIAAARKLTKKQEIESLLSANGGMVTPEKMIEYARDPATALHGSFTWDDTEAAHKCRLWEARRELRIHFSIIEREGVKIETRMFVSLSTDRASPQTRGAYRSVDAVFSDASMRAIHLADVKAELAAFRRKNAAYTELQTVWDAIDNLDPNN